MIEFTPKTLTFKLMGKKSNQAWRYRQYHAEDMHVKNHQQENKNLFYLYQLC